MFSISEYNNLIKSFNTNDIDTSDIDGGGKGRQLLNAVKTMSMYLTISLILTFELLEPLTTDESFNKLKQNLGVQMSFGFISIIAPVIVLLMMYFYNLLESDKKRKSISLMMGVSIVFLLLHFSLTIAALVIGDAYGDETDSDKRAKKRGFLYTKVIGLFIAQGFSIWTIFSTKK